MASGREKGKGDGVSFRGGSVSLARVGSGPRINSVPLQDETAVLSVSHKLKNRLTCFHCTRIFSHTCMYSR